jgi:hypothetical protein
MMRTQHEIIKLEIALNNKIKTLLLVNIIARVKGLSSC